MNLQMKAIDNIKERQSHIYMVENGQLLLVSLPFPICSS
jgi:hypothetical protein